MDTKKMKAQLVGDIRRAAMTPELALLGNDADVLDQYIEFLSDSITELKNVRDIEKREHNGRG